jgi:hypothetical protein
VVSISRFIRIAAFCLVGSAIGPTLLSAQQTQAPTAEATVVAPAATSAPAVIPAPRSSALFEANASAAPTLAAAEEANDAANMAQNSVSISTVTILLVILLLILVV